MVRHRISTGSAFERVAGYSRAVVDDDWCFVSGTTGYDYATMLMPPDVEAQARNAMTTIVRTLDEGGFALADVVRARYHVTDAAYAEAVFAVVGAYFAEIRPVATLTVCGLLMPEMRVEIGVTARRSRR